MEETFENYERKNNSYEECCFLYGEEKLQPRGAKCTTGRARVPVVQKRVCPRWRRTRNLSCRERVNGI
ncbi:hypothetical protein Y032_0608g601 [Ancylostoma ceylanicum]|uniref:Uncharacterized protein n=1 Tax=Ancylostoma ceylanicum TaxID=53326 RepID=A0A016WL69_9BILA|nr:hypothetical protein Y032_0608g601 [Ancylostoma ceylanicum]